MKKHVEQETDRTLDCLGRQEDIQLSPLFVENLCGRISRVRAHRAIGYRSRYFYPVVIVLTAMLNVAVLMATFNIAQSVGSEEKESTDVIAREYGISQSSQFTL